jgi:hypothetical protein
MDKLIEYLNYVYLNEWSNTFHPWGERIIVHLTIKGITRSAVADTEQEAFAKVCKYFSIE